MRIITVNLNGIRAAARAGFFDWLEEQQADLVCMQEIRAQKDQLFDPIFHPKGFYHFIIEAQKKGYSGVALYSRVKPNKVITTLGHELSNTEGRYLQADFADLSVISLYMPSGTSGEIRQTAKYKFMDFFLEHLRQLKNEKREYIICGDWNIAHKNIDLKNWRSNQKNSGFLPEERAWLEHVLEKEGFIDAFRVINQEPDQYTWWSHRGQAYAKNVGWRIDYQIVTPGLKNVIKEVNIYKERRFSDHAPVIIYYDYPLRASNAEKTPDNYLESCCQESVIQY